MSNTFIHFSRKDPPLFYVSSRDLSHKMYFRTYIQQVSASFAHSPETIVSIAATAVHGVALYFEVFAGAKDPAAGGIYADADCSCISEGAVQGVGL